MIIGLTGGIGSGKSVVATMLEILGCAVFNSDDAAKLIYFDSEIKLKVIALLGAKSYLSENAINKSFISESIFNDTTLLRKLNAIIHPAVKNEFEKFLKDNNGRIIVKESALLFEAKINEGMDKIILVTADDELRIERVMKRDNLNREQVLQKIKSQLSQEEKMKLSDYVIYNNEKEFLITQVLNVFQKIKSHA